MSPSGAGNGVPFADKVSQPSVHKAALAKEAAAQFVEMLMYRVYAAMPKLGPELMQVREWKFEDIIHLLSEEKEAWMQACHLEIEALE